MDLTHILAWDDAGPVAILMFVCVCLVLLTRWLLKMVLADKDSQIARLSNMNDKLHGETAATLAQILEALRRKETRP